MMIECVPNFSEGARPEVIEAIVARVRAESGVRVLDLQSDASHNRSVLTLAGDEDALFRGIMALVSACLPVIDLRTQRGEHPRLGAVGAQMLMMGLAFALITTIAYALLGAGAGRVGERLLRRPSIAQRLNRATGVLFIALALRLMLVERG